MGALAVLHNIGTRTLPMSYPSSRHPRNHDEYSVHNVQSDDRHSTVDDIIYNTVQYEIYIAPRVASRYWRHCTPAYTRGLHCVYEKEREREVYGEAQREGGEVHVE